MLIVNGLYKTFNSGTCNQKEALINTSIHVRQGDFISII